MPLSEEELRLLEQMERALAAEDPKFVSALQGRTLERTARIRALAAGVVFLGGVALLLGGVMLPKPWVGILGFVVMLASATLGLSAWRGRHAPHEPPVPDHPFDIGDDHHHGGRPFRLVHGGKRPRRQRKQSGSGSFMQRMEHRWNRRRSQGY
ncbi:DUF3040 domain-containing protein [Nocardioides terrisoli]|uniref:DUF3040 domain-containing protein n=1 Tax=Nocardioides terrisoli TaxID=3388267 RepID=UPI00287B7E88|nr:DUF3040 domain-containing protein [Nocardioides marmorisolisilvae]